MGSVADSVGTKVLLLFQFYKLFKEKLPKIGQKSVFGVISSASKVVIGELFQRLPPRLVDELKQYYWVDVSPPHSHRQVQMRTGRAACAAAYTHHITRPHAVSLLHSPFGQMAIADREIPVPHGDIFSGHPVLSGFHHDAVHHSVSLTPVSPQVQTVVFPALFRERVSTHTERRCNMNLF